jgi:peptidoglycan/xylan/chitin deacetylase (PgdA/CDA1 family)
MWCGASGPTARHGGVSGPRRWWHSGRRSAATTLVAAGVAGYRQMMLWDVDPRDWQYPGAEVIVGRALADCSTGSVVDLHVTAQTAEALPALIAGLRQRGLPCLPLTAVAPRRARR